MPAEVAAEVASALTAAGAALGSLTPLPGGHGGSTVVATTERGRVVVKVRPLWSPLAVASSASRLLAGRGLAHPEVVTPPTATTVGWVMGVRWVPGRPLAQDDVGDWTPRQARAMGADLGAWLAGVHAIRAPRRSWAERAERRFRSKVQRCVDRGNLTPDLVEGLRRFWDGLRPALAGAPVTLIHRDLHAGNVIAYDRAFAAAIDLEQARLADPLYDLVKLSESVLGRHPLIGPAFRDAYGLDLDAPGIRDRLAAVFVLEYLSAVVYFDKHGDRDGVRDRRERLARALQTPVRIP
jgi:aminoglycoside phosphotransferase (APT) family kinase protein